MDGRRKSERGPGAAAHNRPGGWIWVALTSFLLIGPPAVAAAGDETIDAGTFRFTVPDGGGWNISREPDRILLKRDRLSSDHRIGTTAVLVLRTRPVDSECGLPAEETAANYCDDEEFQLWLNGQLKGLFGVSEVERETVMIDRKQMYTMHYRLEFAPEYGGARTDNRTYIYFPPTFEIDNHFFVFMQTEACLPHHCGDQWAVMDETLLRHVISSLQMPADRP